MKKYLFLILLLIITFSEEKKVIGYINYLSDLDIKKISISDDPNTYLEKKYKGLYYAKIENDYIRIYPRLTKIEVEEKTLKNTNILDIIPSIKVGTIIEEGNDVISPLNNEIIKENYLFDMDYLYEIDDDGRMKLKIVNKNDKEHYIKVGMKLKKDRALAHLKYSKNNLITNDLINLEALVSIKDYNNIINFNYNFFDFKGNKVKVNVGYNSNDGFNFGSQYLRYILVKDGNTNQHIIKPKISLNYSRKDSSKFTFETGINYKNIFQNEISLNLESNLNYNVFKDFNDNFFIFKNNIDVEFSLLKSKNEIILALSKLDKKNKINSKQTRTVDFKEISSDYIISSENEIMTSDILNFKIYAFSDLFIFGNYSEKTNLNTGNGLGMIYDIYPIKINGYMGFKFNPTKKINLMGGLNLEFDI